MKRLFPVRTGFILAVFLFLSGCGDDLISGLKDFTPNTPPVIGDFTFTAPVGQDTEIHPSMQFDLTVTATDADNDDIDYTFTSEYGSFAGLNVTPGACTATFFMGTTCPPAGSQGIPVTVTVTDGRAGSVSRTVYPGGTIQALEITSNLADRTLSSGGTYTFTFSSNCSGYYQVRHIDSGAAQNITYDGTNCYPRAGGSQVSMTINAGTGYNNSTTYYLSAETGDEYRVYVIFRDNFNRDSLVSAIINVE